MFRTKIVATLGPATDTAEKIGAMIKAGVSIFRFNTRHGDISWHREKVKLVRQVAKKLGKPVGILMDLQGPEIRIGVFPEGGINIKNNEEVVFSDKEESEGGLKHIYICTLPFIYGFKPGSTIYLDNGYLEFKVVKVENQGRKLIAKAIKGGFLKSNKGVNLPELEIDLPSLTAKDLTFIRMPENKEVDYFGYSFVRDKNDMVLLRKELDKQKLSTGIVAKIENRQAVDNFEEILAMADAIMVARGDLGIELLPEEVPYWQKHMIKRCREEAKPVITATQMLESMIQNSRPTRAEVSDVANAIYDGTDAVMLSAESASGNYPLEAINIMARIIKRYENIADKLEINPKIDDLPKAITYSAFKILQNDFIQKIKIEAYLIFTETGKTVHLLSRFRPKIPIMAMTRVKELRGRLCLVYGVIPFYCGFPEGKIQSLVYFLSYLKEKGLFKKGDDIVAIHGHNWRVPSQTNTIRVEKVE